VDTADKTALYGYAGGTVQARRLAEYTGVQEAKIRYSEYNHNNICPDEYHYASVLRCCRAEFHWAGRDSVEFYV
jgi:hypothetical protein